MCGNLNSVSDDLKFGDHPPGLEVDFRSNRINLQNDVEFYLVMTCTIPSTTAAGTQTSKPLTSNGSDKTKQCTPSRSLRQVVGDYSSIINPAQHYLVSEP